MFEPGIVGKKKIPDGPTQRACDIRRALGPIVGGADAKTAFDPDGLLNGLKKTLAERVLNAEMDHHLDGEGGLGNGHVVYTKEIEFTDFPCEEITLWFANNVILLPSEY